MQQRDSLNKILLNNTAASKLKKGSTATLAVKALQTLLHWLGFDRELNWQKYGADGDYGRSTTAAIASFAKRNDSSASGTRVSQQLLQKILDCYDMLEALKQFSEDLDKGRVERYYRFLGSDKIRIATLQTLLNELGFGLELKWEKYGADGDYGRSTLAAVKALAKREGENNRGYIVTSTLAEGIIRQLTARLGDNWNHPESTVQTIEKLEVKSVIGNRNRQYIKVSNGSSSKQFAQFRKGLYTIGSHKPLQFMQSHVAELRALKITSSAINIMVAVAENESGQSIEEQLVQLMRDVNERLEKHEHLASIYISSTIWSPFNGLLTPTMKIKRQQIEKMFAHWVEKIAKPGVHRLPAVD